MGDKLPNWSGQMQELPLPVWSGRTLRAFHEIACAASANRRLLNSERTPILAAMVEPRRLYEQISRKLAKSIADGEYAVGDRLPSERELAQNFKISRPTVREAIIALELDGLVEVRVGSGVYVMSRQPPGGREGAKDIGPFELLEARHAIEGEAAALAAERIDDEQLK